MRRSSIGWALTVLTLLSTTWPARAKVPVDLQLVLAVDISGSIDADEAKMQRDGYIAALGSPEVIKAILSGPFRRIAITYFEWSEAVSQVMVVPWRLIDDHKAALGLADTLADTPISRGRFTSISGAIQYAIPLFDVSPYEGVRRVIDISGDGPNNNGILVIAARDLALSKGITINGLPIVNERMERFGPPMPNLDLYFRDCVIGGPGAFYVVAESFASFGLAVRRKLVLEIAGLAPPPPRLFQRAQDRVAPPCDEGERMWQRRFLNRF
jgi:Protein of unknown function (DUF1194)